jgi:hypothetical protein
MLKTVSSSVLWVQLCCRPCGLSPPTLFVRDMLRSCRVRVAIVILKVRIMFEAIRSKLTYVGGIVAKT